MQVSKIRWDAMHACNLGVDLWISASTLRGLLDYEHLWGGADMHDDDRLMLAYKDFRQWSRDHKWQRFGYSLDLS